MRHVHHGHWVLHTVACFNTLVCQRQHVPHGSHSFRDGDIPHGKRVDRVSALGIM